MKLMLDTRSVAKLTAILTLSFLLLWQGPVLAADLTAKQLIERGEAKFAKKDLDGALADFKLAIKADPEDWIALNNAGVVLERQMKPSASLPYLMKAVQLEKNTASIYVVLSNVLTDLRRYNDAIDATNWTIAIEPNNKVAYNNRGSAHSWLGEIVKACADIRKALDIDPEFQKALQNLKILKNQGRGRCLP